MARLTWKEIIAEIQRYPGLDTFSLGEIIDTMASVATDLSNEPWPWNYAETNVLLPAAYSTGTVSVNDGSSTVTGNLTAWNVLWYGRRIRFGNSNLDYIVDVIAGPNSLTLTQPVNLGSSLVNSSYTMYQDTYLYPEDYIVGSDVALLQPTIRTRIPKIPRYKFEMIMNAGLRSFSTNIQMFYCDQGQDIRKATATFGRLRFRLGPPPTGPAELRLCYHQFSPGIVTSLDYTNYVPLPEGFDEIITLATASKLYDLHGMPDKAEPVKRIAAGKIKLLKRQVMTQTIDDVPDATFETPDSSISQWGMVIGRM